MVPAYEPPAGRAKLKAVKPFLIKRDDLIGLEAEAFVDEGYRKGEMITYYSGRLTSEGMYLFSKHVYTLATFHARVDGSFGSGL